MIDLKPIIKTMLDGTILRLEAMLDDKSDPVNYKSGICMQLSKARYYATKQIPESHNKELLVVADVGDGFLHEAFMSWEHWSGDVFFPVSHPLFSDPEQAYDAGNFWYGTYGENRRALARHVIKHFRKVLSENDFQKKIDSAKAYRKVQ